MTLSFRGYLLRLVLFTAIIALSSAVVWLLAPAEYLTPTLPGFPIFFFLVTALVHRSLITKVGEGNRFIQQYMMVTVGKLLLFMAILLVYAFTYTSDALAFTIAFLAYYILFTVFEVIHLLNIARTPR